MEDLCILYFCETYFCLPFQLHLNICSSSNEHEARREESLDLCQGGSALASPTVLPLCVCARWGQRGHSIIGYCRSRFWYVDRGL